MGRGTGEGVRQGLSNQTGCGSELLTSACHSRRPTFGLLAGEDAMPQHRCRPQFLVARHQAALQTQIDTLTFW